MRPNIGTTDRALRLALGVILIALALLAGLDGAARVAALVAGLVMVGTAAIRFCPLYTLFGLRTCRR
ncbi:MAG: DUF2892 domain-containing protein [Paracoccus hibiscisoli]|uniref:YgaP family membrane protein n=1 Tax=Paracoccus hibiscisoli TaxID=2023261 RepID=UPI00391AB017